MDQPLEKEPLPERLELERTVTLVLETKSTDAVSEIAPCPT